MGMRGSGRPRPGGAAVVRCRGGRLKSLAAIYVDDKGAALNLPEGVACDASGQVVVGDTGNDRLLRFTFR